MYLTNRENIWKSLTFRGREKKTQDFPRINSLTYEFYILPIIDPQVDFLPWETMKFRIFVKNFKDARLIVWKKRI